MDGAVKGKEGGLLFEIELGGILNCGWGIWEGLLSVSVYVRSCFLLMTEAELINGVQRCYGYKRNGHS